MTKLYITITLFMISPNYLFADQKISLNQYLATASEQNLDLKIESAKLNSAEAKANGINIPPPMIGFTEMRPESGRTGRGFEINQTIPFPTKLTGDASARAYAARAQAENKKGRSQEIMAQAKFLFISLWAMQEKLILLDEKRKVVVDHIKLARSTARSDSFAKIHLLKAESDLDFLDNDIEEAHQKLRELQSQTAIVLNFDPAQMKLVAEDPPLSEIPRDLSSDKSPQVKAAQLTAESMKSVQTAARSTWLPDFNLKYKKMDQTIMGPSYEEFMVGVTLPFVLFWQPNATSKKASADSATAQYEFERRKRTFESDKVSLLNRCESLKKQLQTLNDKLIPRAFSRVKLIRNIAPRDMASLQDYRDTLEAFPDLKIRALNLRLQYEQSIAALERYADSQGF